MASEPSSFPNCHSNSRIEVPYVGGEGTRICLLFQKLEHFPVSEAVILFHEGVSGECHLESRAPGYASDETSLSAHVGDMWCGARVRVRSHSITYMPVPMTVGREDWVIQVVRNRFVSCIRLQHLHRG